MIREGLYSKAARAAEKVRIELSLNMFEALNIFDVCDHYNIEVRFVSINMEGLYISSKNTNIILISSERPLVRQSFTCAHEFGHFYFDHGSKIDELNGDTNSYNPIQDNEESLVDAFAGYLLMPIAGIELFFFRNKIDPNNATHIDFYTLSSYFGVGYSTIVHHCKANRIISSFKANYLLKYTPQKIFSEVSESRFPKSKFRYLTNGIKISILEVELSTYLFLPLDCSIDSSNLEKIEENETTTIYRAVKCGIVNGCQRIRNNEFIVRIQKFGYTGLSEFRHLDTGINNGNNINRK